MHLMTPTLGQRERAARAAGHAREASSQRLNAQPDCSIKDAASPQWPDFYIEQKSFVGRMACRQFRPSEVCPESFDRRRCLITPRLAPRYMPRRGAAAFNCLDNAKMILRRRFISS